MKVTDHLVADVTAVGSAIVEVRPQNQFVELLHPGLRNDRMIHPAIPVNPAKVCAVRFFNIQSAATASPAMKPEPEAGGRNPFAVRIEKLEEGWSLTAAASGAALEVHLKEIVRHHRDRQHWQRGTAANQIGPRDDRAGPFITDKRRRTKQGRINNLDRFAVQPA